MSCAFEGSHTQVHWRSLACASQLLSRWPLSCPAAKLSSWDFVSPCRRLAPGSRVCGTHLVYHRRLDAGDLNDRRAAMSEETTTQASAIPEIYYDILARVVPGALILIAYTWKDIGKDFHTSNLTVGLLFSYILGLSLNLVAERFWYYAFKSRRKIWKGKKQDKTDSDLWLWIRSLPLVDRNLYTKMMAEKMLFSSLNVGSLCMCFVPPFVAHIGRWYSAGLFAIFSAI